MSSSSRAPSKLLSKGGSWEPAFIYGTAWKKEKTCELVKLAVDKGFRSVDTAAQPRHYQEELVGEALRQAYRSGKAKREDVYLQTKYTTPAGQDLTDMPYDPSSPLHDQVTTSISSSLKNLRPDETEENSHIDCVLLHSPLPTTEQTISAWKILESYVPSKIRALGISNVNLATLEAIYINSTVKPSVVQNRFYPQTGYDVTLRAFCAQHDITYQSFWTLTGNPELLQSRPVASLSEAVGVSRFVALYAFVMDQGIVVLNGTTTAGHMEEDFDGVRRVREWASGRKEEWRAIAEGFEEIIGSGGV